MFDIETRRHRRQCLSVATVVFAIFVQSCESEDGATEKADLAKEARVIFLGKKHVAVTVDVADNARERSAGFGDRKSLDTKAGLLYVYPRQKKRSFWMA